MYIEIDNRVLHPYIKQININEQLQCSSVCNKVRYSIVWKAFNHAIRSVKDEKVICIMHNIFTILKHSLGKSYEWENEYISIKCYPRGVLKSSAIPYAKWEVCQLVDQIHILSNGLCHMQLKIPFIHFILLLLSVRWFIHTFFFGGWLDG